jgi:negative regulator of sigma E activity
MSMNERESQLSAMYDGELPTAERELVARRLSRDAAMRETWGNYALIGAVMRGESLASGVAPRVAASIARLETAAQLEREPADTPAAAAERTPRLPRWAVPASGFGLAAGVAVVGVFAVLWLGSQPPTPVTGASVAGAAMVPIAKSRVAEVVIPAAPESTVTPDEMLLAAAAGPAPRATSSNGEPLSYVTPPVEQARTPAGPQPFNLASYVGAHSAVSAPMMRHSAISATIAVESAAVQPESETVR